MDTASKIGLDDMSPSTEEPSSGALAPDMWQITAGDAYDLSTTVAKASVDLILTSPPYWGQRTYGRVHNWSIIDEWKKTCAGTDIPNYRWYRDHGGVLGLEPTPDWYVCHLVEVLQRFAHCLKPSGSLWVNLGDTYFARWASIREGGCQGLGDNPRQRRRVPMGDYRHEKQLLLIPARFAILSLRLPACATAAGRKRYLEAALFPLEARITASKAGFGLSSVSNSSGFPLALQETPSLTPHMVTTFTDLCLRKAVKRL